MKYLIVSVLTVLAGLTLVECQCENRELLRCLSRAADLDLRDAPSSRDELARICRLADIDLDLDCIRDLDLRCKETHQRDLLALSKRILLKNRALLCDSGLGIDILARANKCIGKSRAAIREKLLSLILNQLDLLANRSGLALRDILIRSCCQYSRLIEEAADLLRSSGDCDDESLLLNILGIDLILDNAYGDVCKPSRILDLRADLIADLSASADLAILRTDQCQETIRDARILRADDLAAILRDAQAALRLLGARRRDLGELDAILLNSNLRRILLDIDLDLDADLALLDAPSLLIAIIDAIRDIEAII